MLFGAASCGRAATITWTNLGGGNWTTAANWDPNQVPSTNDTALITTAGTYAVLLSPGSVGVSNLTLGGESGVQTLLVAGTTFSVADSGTVASNGVVNWKGGVFNGGTLGVEGAFNWSAGTLTGAINIATSGVMTISGAADKTFSGGLIANTGTITWNDSGRIVNGGSIDNGGLFEARNDSVITGGSFTNRGTLRKALGTNETLVDLSFNNSGTVDAQSGTLTFQTKGSSDGVFNAASNALIQLRSPPFPPPASTFYTINNGSSFTGPGLKRLIGGYVLFDGIVMAHNLELGYATRGNWTLTGGPVFWTGGGIQDKLNISSEVVMNISSSSSKTISGQINNFGSINWTGSGSIAFGGCGANASAIFNNSGTFDIKSDPSILLVCLGSNLISNTGIFRKSSGTNTTMIPFGITFSNSGLVDVQSGGLSIGGGGNLNGTFNSGSNASILFQFGSPNFSYLSTNGIFNVVSNGLIEFDGGFSGNGVAFTGAGPKRFAANYNTLYGHITAQNLELAGGGIGGDCTLTDGPVMWIGGNFSGSITISSNAVLFISGASGKGSGDQFINNGTAFWTSSGTLDLSYNGVFINSGSFFVESKMMVRGLDSCFLNTGLFRKEDGTNTLIFPMFQVPFSNSGTVDVQNGTLDINNFPANYHCAGPGAGVFNAASNAVILYGGSYASHESSSGFTGTGLKRLSGSITLNGPLAAQNVELAGATVLGNGTLTGGPVRWTSGYIQGMVTIPSGVSLVISSNRTKFLNSVLSNGGSATWTDSGAFEIDNGGLFFNSGTFDIQNDASLVSGNTGSVSNSGLFRKLAGTNTMVGATITFNNTGTLEVQSGNLTFNGSFTQSAGLTRLAGGHLSSAAPLNINGGSLAGYGSIFGDVINAGTVSPGDLVGALNITGNYKQTGELDIDIGGLLPGSEHDRLNVGGSANLRGALRLAFSNGFKPSLGDSFSVLTYGSRVGAFDCVIGSNLGGGTNLVPNYGAAQLALVATNLPVHTNAMSVFYCGGRSSHLQFSGLPGQTYSLQATTNFTVTTNCVAPGDCVLLSAFADWVTLLTTNTPTGVVDFDDPDAASFDHRFYRARLGP